MKNYNIHFRLVLLSFLKLGPCNDEFLERFPLDHGQ